MSEQPEKRGRGRPATYATPAERAKAWRQRQKDMLAAALAQEPAPVEPVVIEKIVERIIEKPVKAPAAHRSKAAKEPDASALFPALRDRFKHYKGEEEAKRFRVNAAKAATAAREVLKLVTSQYSTTPVPETEREFLSQAARFFDELNGVFHNAQLGAKHAKEKAEKAANEKRAAEVKAMKLEIFGAQHTAADVLAMAADMMKFDREAGDWLAKKYRVTSGYFFVDRSYDLRRAVEDGNAMTAANILAEVRIEYGDKGRHWNNDGETCYRACWNDFMEYRTNAKQGDQPSI